MNAWEINTTRCKKLAAIASGWKTNLLQLFVKWKWVSTSLWNIAFLFWPDEGSCYVIFTRNNWCEFFPKKVIYYLQSAHWSFIKKNSSTTKIKMINNDFFSTITIKHNFWYNFLGYKESINVTIQHTMYCLC